MKGHKILVIDDEASIRKLLRVSLSGHGYQVFEAESGVDGIGKMGEVRPDLVVLDLGLPDLSGVDVVRQAREWTDLPIIILSVRDRERDKVEALDAGADDYLTKPFGLAELLARIRSALRRTHRHRDGGTAFHCGELTVDLEARLVKVKERPIQLTPTEYELLKALVNQAGRVLTHQQILAKVWGDDYEGDPHMLRVNISNLRKKLEPNPVRPRYIVTEPGVGYRLRTD